MGKRRETHKRDAEGNDTRDDLANDKRLVPRVSGREGELGVVGHISERCDKAMRGRERKKEGSTSAREPYEGSR